MNSNVFKDAVDTIKRTVRMSEVLEANHIEINRGGFCNCCFHTGDRTASMKVYDYSFYCFGCHEHGSVIDFYMKYFGMEFKPAVERINIDFGLHLPIGDDAPKLSQMREAADRVRRTNAENEARKQAEHEESERYWNALEKFILYDNWKRDYAPQSPDDPIDERYVIATFWWPYYKYYYSE